MVKVSRYITPLVTDIVSNCSDFLYPIDFNLRFVPC